MPCFDAGSTSTILLNLVVTEHRTMRYTRMIRSKSHQAGRRERDARASEDFEAGVVTISEDMERRVLEASYRLRDGLEEVEEAVSIVRRELYMDHRLVEGNMAYVKVRKGARNDPRPAFQGFQRATNKRTTRFMEMEGLEASFAGA